MEALKREPSFDMAPRCEKLKFEIYSRREKTRVFRCLMDLG